MKRQEMEAIIKRLKKLHPYMDFVVEEATPHEIVLHSHIFYLEGFIEGLLETEIWKTEK